MNYDAAKLYKSIDFLEAVEVLVELRPKTGSYLFERKDRRTRREIRQTRESHKELFGCTIYNNR